MFDVIIFIALKELNSLMLNNAYDMLMSELLSSSLTFFVMNQIIIACKILNVHSFNCWSSLFLFLFEMITCKNVWTTNLNMLDADFLSDLNIHVSFALIWCMWCDFRIECIQVDCNSFQCINWFRWNINQIDHDNLQCINWFRWNINHESIKF